MKFKFIKKISFLIFLLTPVLFCACKSSPAQGTKIKTDFITSLDQEPFYIQTKHSFEEKKLSNGIPLIIKTSPSQKDCTVNLVIDAEALKDPERKAGIEQITLNLIKLGSASYSSHYISSLEYTDSAYFNCAAHRDYLEFGFSAMPEGLENIIKVFGDVFKTPLMDTEEFSRLKEEALSEREKCLDDSRERLLESLYNRLKAKDSYFTDNSYSAASDISYQDVLSYQKSLLNARKIKIVASGNFKAQDVEKLYSELNAQFGSLKARDYKKRVPSIKTVDLNPSESPVIVSGDGLKNQSLAGVYHVPPVCSAEYIKYSLMSLYIDDILYSDLKEKNKYALDAGTGLITGVIPLGVLMIYDLKTQNDLISYTAELTQKAFDSDAFEKKLDSYKRIYISIVMSSELSSAKTCSQMAMSLVYSGDASDYIKRPYRIRTVTAEDVKKAFNDSIGGSILWFAFSRD